MFSFSFLFLINWMDRWKEGQTDGVDGQTDGVDGQMEGGTD